MMTRPELTSVLESDEFTEADKCAIRWQYDLYGGFFKALYDAIARADYFNTEKLRLGFPDEVQGYLNWTQGDLYERIERFLAKQH